MKKKITGALFVTMFLIGNRQKIVEASPVATQNVVYRVYIDDEAVGLITDKNEYDSLINEQKEELSKQYEKQTIIKSPTNVRLEKEVTLLPLNTIDNEAALEAIAQKQIFKLQRIEFQLGMNSLL